MRVVEALAAVAAKLPPIGKTNRSPEGYAYRGIEDIVAAASKLLAEHAVVICPSTTIMSITPVAGMKEGWQDVQVTVDWTIHGPDGDHITARTVGIGRDKSDKGANKAHTQAKKYLLMDLLHVADAADDAEAHDTTDPAPPPPVDVRAEMDAIKALNSPDRRRLWDLLHVPESDKPWAAIASVMASDPAKLAAARSFLRAVTAEGRGPEPATPNEPTLDGEEAVAASIADTFGGAAPPDPTTATRTTRTRRNPA